jgi:hypothetical protein
MERLDRIEGDQLSWDTKKVFVNSVRVQALDRLYQKKIENEQRELASQWAPHVKARGEVHDSLKGFSDELDSMPVKELKKVLTPCVLKKDREGIRNITKKIQAEETWKHALKQVEKDRRDDTRSSLEQRRAYNAMVMELSGQPFPRGDPHHTVPNLTPRLLELAQHTVVSGPKQVTQLIDYKGLVHVDNRRALESRFPGTGHELSVQFCDGIEEQSREEGPPTKGPATPTFSSKRGTILTAGSSVKKGAVPVSATRLQQVPQRQNDVMTLLGAAEQFESKIAPPAPDQRRSVLVQPLVNDTLHMESMASSCGFSTRNQSKVGPGTRKTYYEVIVPTVESSMERPNWRPRRAAVMAQVTPGGTGSEGDPVSKSRGSRKSVAWPPAWSRPVQVFIGAARGLPKADRSGHSDPYATCQVLGKPRSKVKTHVVGDTECPTFNEAFTVVGWNEGEALDFTIFDHDLSGAHDMIATIVMTADQFYPNGFEGTVPLQNTWAPDGKVPAELKAFNLAQRPSMDVRVFVPPLEEGAERPPRSGALEEEPRINMPGAAPTTGNVCRDLDDFDTGARPADRLGNFWMSLPSKTARSSDGR